jgi:hypothetical protein
LFKVRIYFLIRFVDIKHLFSSRSLEQLDLSYLPLSFHAQKKLCEMMNPLIFGYCPILSLNLTRTGFVKRETILFSIFVDWGSRDAARSSKH